MTPDDWKKVKYFTARENWGDASLIEPELIFRLDSFREFIDSPVVVSCGTQGAHVEHSQHALGRAVDIIVATHTITAVDLILGASRFGFTGIGYYPDWHIGSEQYGGLHLDVREITPYTQASHWMGVVDFKTGKRSYIDLTMKNLKIYCPIGFF